MMTAYPFSFAIYIHIAFVAVNSAARMQLVMECLEHDRARRGAIDIKCHSETTPIVPPQVSIPPLGGDRAADVIKLCVKYSRAKR